MEIANEGVEPHAALRHHAGAATQAHPYRRPRVGWKAVLFGPLVVWFLTNQRVMGFFRTVCPIPRVPGWAAVTRYDDVAEVLTRHDIFGVPFGDQIAELNDAVENKHTREKSRTPFT